MATLPTRLRLNIRDHVTSDESSLAQRTETLKETLGYPVHLDPEWLMLWTMLQAYYPDQAIFVPNVASTIISWCDAFTIWTEDENNEESVDKLLQALKSKGRLEIVLEVSAKAATRPITTWSSTKSVFVIAFPKLQIPPQQTVVAGFSGDLLTIFSPSPVLGASSHPGTSDPEKDSEDWADLDLGAIDVQPTLPLRNPHRPEIQALGEDRMPEISTIPRPEELVRQPPYWMVVSQGGRTRVTVEASHAPSLACLNEYLRRWCRGDVNRVNRPPVVEIKLVESAFGLGLLHDTLTLEAIRGKEVSAMLILSFVENVLGYTPVISSGSAGCVWEFKRTRGFK